MPEPGNDRTTPPQYGSIAACAGGLDAGNNVSALARTAKGESACRELGSGRRELGPALILLARPGVGVAVGVCSAAGALLRFLAVSEGRSAVGLPEAAVVCGVCVASFLLCAGCSAINQVQEVATDALMARTARRPVACGRMSRASAMVWGAGWSLAGLGLFAALGGWSLLLAGCVVLLTYNGLYTPLKKFSCMSILIGGVAGALPPVTGWLAAGGSVTDPVAVAGFSALYLWQVPHFWMLSEKYAAEYRRAGIPVAAHVFSGTMYRALLGLWTGACLAALALTAGFLGMAHVGLGLLAAAPVVACLRIGRQPRSAHMAAGA